MGSGDLQTKKTLTSKRCWVVIVSKVFETAISSDDLELCGKSSEIYCEKTTFQNELQFAKRQLEKNFKKASVVEFFLERNSLEFLS